MDKSLISSGWLERVLQTYPAQSCRLWQLEEDPFRNPVGYALKEGLSVLVEEVLGGMDRDRIIPALDAIVRLRAVQDFTAGQAVSFVFPLREVIREHLGEDLLFQQRIDELALLAFDRFITCREQMHEIKAQELRRSMHVLSRIDHARSR